MKIKIALAMALAVALSGCVTLNPTTAETALQMAVAVGRVISPSSVSKLDKTISEVAGSKSVTAACAVFQTAAGYYSALRGAIPDKYARIGDPAVSAGHALCVAPPTDTGQALTTLNRLWAGVQDATRTR